MEVLLKFLFMFGLLLLNACVVQYCWNHSLVELLSVKNMDFSSAFLVTVLFRSLLNGAKVTISNNNGVK